MGIKEMQEHIERLEKTRNLLTDQLEDFLADCIKDLLKNNVTGILNFRSPLQDMYCYVVDKKIDILAIEYNQEADTVLVFGNEKKYQVGDFNDDTLIVLFYSILNVIDPL